MNPIDLIRKLDDVGVRLREHDGRLFASGDRQMLSEQLRQEIEERRDDLLVVLRELAQTVENVQEASTEDQNLWRQEVVWSLWWREAGGQDVPWLDHDLAALRRVLPPMSCLDCGAATTPHRRLWCPNHSQRAAIVRSVKD